MNSRLVGIHKISEGVTVHVHEEGRHRRLHEGCDQLDKAWKRCAQARLEWPRRGFGGAAVMATRGIKDPEQYEGEQHHSQDHSGTDISATET